MPRLLQVAELLQAATASPVMVALGIPVNFLHISYTCLHMPVHAERLFSVRACLWTPSPSRPLLSPVPDQLAAILLAAVQQAAELWLQRQRGVASSHSP